MDNQPSMTPQKLGDKENPKNKHTWMPLGRGNKQELPRKIGSMGVGEGEGKVEGKRKRRMEKGEWEKWIERELVFGM